jgi:Fe-Mn family superoxide dismutase
MNDDLGRRRLLNLGFSAAALALASCAAPAEAEPAPKTPATPPRGATPPGPKLALAAAPAEKQLVALPFAPGSIPGLSEKLLTNHHDKNYATAVKKLNEVRTALAASDPDKAAGYWSEFGTLKSAEAAARNSALLHELYFANLGGAGAPISPALGAALGARFGSPAALEKQMRGCAQATNGWVVLALDRASSTLEIVQTDGHAGGAWNAESLLVLDMFEHAYAIDYGPAKGPYLDAFFKNVHWAEVGRRFDAALARG